MKLIVAALSIALVSSAPAWGQAYPTKPVRLIIGGLPGTRRRHSTPMARMSESMVIPSSWQSRGGPSSLGAFTAPHSRRYTSSSLAAASCQSYSYNASYTGLDFTR